MSQLSAPDCRSFAAVPNVQLLSLGAFGNRTLAFVFCSVGPALSLLDPA